MENNLRLAIFLVALVLLLFVMYLLRKGRLPIKFALLWFTAILLLLIVAILPDMLLWLMNLVGFVTLSNLIIGILFVILIFITISLTVIISGQREKIRILIQEVSILKEEVDNLENRK
ncbi:DUF2304 domain-containing protein [Breznakia pachnodae]|uniref:DUF2304 domain-containing protein n=1 Tax=Breznakia pachnodae TaxID=265178 RepID=A0ABU0DZB6_9FIRM|nr:DUF2304 domain-containing protein [Breznakia pachnodae]MDQ0359796.1 hypothetical protein [Breznakia pachnodae]